MENPRYISTDLVRFGDENHLALEGDLEIRDRLHQRGANERDQEGLKYEQLAAQWASDF